LTSWLKIESQQEQQVNWLFSVLIKNKIKEANSKGKGE